jgi:hypothetical protein
VSADPLLRAMVDDGIVSAAAPRLLLLEPEPLIESLTWLPATEPLPDADERVLILIEDADGARDWDTGFYDRDDGAWRLCESGGKVCGTVVLFARPQGPAC